MALFEIDGAVSFARGFTFDELRASGRQMVERSVLLGGRAITGVRLGVVVEALAIKPWARFVVVSGGDGYVANVPLAAVHDCVLVYAVGDQPLPRDLGGPVRLLTRGLDECTNVKAVERLTFAEHADPVAHRCDHGAHHGRVSMIAAGGRRS